MSDAHEHDTDAPFQQRLLTHPVIGRRNAQASELPRLARLGYQMLENGLGHVRAIPQFLMQSVEIRIPGRLERCQVLSIHAPGSPVAFHLLPSHIQVLPLVDLVHQWVDFPLSAGLIQCTSLLGP